MPGEVDSGDISFPNALSVLLDLITGGSAKLLGVEGEAYRLQLARRSRRLGDGGSGVRGLGAYTAVILAGFALATLRLALAETGDRITAPVGTCLSGRAVSVVAALLAVSVHAVFPMALAVIVIIAIGILGAAAGHQREDQSGPKRLVSAVHVG